MTPPTIHLNGTSRERLLDGFMEASQAIEAAYQAIKQTAPNGRDYYPQGARAMEAAEAEHYSRLSRLDAIKKELDEMASAVSQGA